MTMKKKSVNRPLKRSVTIRIPEDVFVAYEQESIRLHIAFSELMRKELARKLPNKKKSVT
jgi:hypothetical protein